MSSGPNSGDAGPKPDGLLEVGRIGKAHGLRGEVLVSLITNATERVDVGAHLWTDDRHFVVRSSTRHQHRWRVAFDGVATRPDAEALAGCVLFAEPIDDPGSLWFHDLIGMNVVLADGSGVGVVEAIQDNPASDLLVLDGGALVPMVFVVEISEAHIVIDPPPGLLELADN